MSIDKNKYTLSFYKTGDDEKNLKVFHHLV